MALIVNQNLYSMSSQNYLSVNQAALGKSIERLSSGLRINRAADDASGMAISEQMRGQIAGLKRASMNAQDGISYLQTAEGAMEQTSAMLQRMRELAVQASNGIYTTNDRAELQKEIDQLKEEIDRISVSTEFNTRKLLNGSATALWSASSDKIGAIIRGPVAEGNYEITMSVKPGKNQIFKTDIMTLNEGAIGAEMVSETEGGRKNTTNVIGVSNPVTMPATGDSFFNVTIGNSASATAGTLSAGFTAGSVIPKGTFLNNSIEFSAGATAATAFTITLLNGTTMSFAVGQNIGGLTISAGVTVTAGGITVTVDAADNAGPYTLLKNRPTEHPITMTDPFTTTQNIYRPDGTIFLSAGNTLGAGETLPPGIYVTGTMTLNATGGTYTGDIGARADLVNTYQQEGSAWVLQGVGVVSTGQTAALNTSSGYMEIEFLNSTNDLGELQFRMRFIDAVTGDISPWQPHTTAATNNGSGSFTVDFSYDHDGRSHNVNFNFIMCFGGQNSTGDTIGRVVAGDKMLVAISKFVEEDSINVGGGSINMSGGPRGVPGPTVYFTEPNSLTPEDNGDNVLDKQSATVFHVDMDERTGNINIGNLTFEFKETARGETVAGVFDVAIRGGGEAATTSTKLRDIARFTNADGRNIFEIKQELRVFGNGTSTVVHLEGNDSIATFIEKMTKAIVVDLGMGSSDPQVNKNLVNYISSPDETGWGTIKGTFLIQTALAGLDGRLSFVGDQALIDALSMAEVQSAANGESTVSIRNAHTGNLIGTEVTGNGRVHTLIDGVELTIDSRAGVLSRWDSARNKIVFESNPTLQSQKHYLHLVDNRTSLQIGANKGQDVNVSIPQLDIVGLGLENTVVVSQKLAREAIGQIDMALQRLVSARATIGAQVSRLEYTIQNLATARQNLTAAESRIRDLDIAEESTNFTKNQILTQSGIAMLAQANQLPQMALQLIQG